MTDKALFLIAGTLTSVALAVIAARLVVVFWMIPLT